MPHLKSALAIVIVAAFFAATSDAQDTPAIVEIKDIAVKPTAYQRPTKPVEIKSLDEAAKHFRAEGVAKLKAKVDFEKQRVVLFAWRGSGQDKITYDVAESFPEQILFHYKPGRTRDLRPHVKVYALRLNVKHSMSKAGN